MITIISFILFWLATYVWIHQQILINTEKEKTQQEQILKNIQKEFKKMETKLTNQEKEIQENINEEKQTLLDNNNFPASNPNEEGVIFQPSDPQKFIGFDKLIGFKEELKAVQGFINYLKNPDNYKGIGEVESPLGILMYGCPGTGKTTLARALAKETNLPFFEVNSSLFSQKYKGVAPQMVKDLFTEARNVAEESNGAIIFLDECETIFTDLSMLEAGSEITNVVNQFKTEMTSMENNPEKPIFIIGATNQYHLIDEAIKSRFTYNIETKPGNKAERQQMLEFLIKRRKNPYSEEAKQYLFEVINEALENLPQNQHFLKANRTLENLLKTTVSIFAENRGTNKNKRKKLTRSAIFYVLNKYAFRGVFKYQKNGKIYMSFVYQKSTKKPIIDLEELQIIKNNFTNSKLLNIDFESVINQSKSNDFIFVDPPYFQKDIKDKDFYQNPFTFTTIKDLNMH